MIVGGKLASMIGAVSLDLTTIDVIVCAGVNVGDVVKLLGSENGVSIDARRSLRIVCCLVFMHA